MAQLVIHVYMLEQGGPSVPISQAGTCQATSTKVEAGTVFPILLNGNGNVKEKYPFFGGSGGHVSWYEDTSNACPGPGVFPIWPLARKIGKHQQAHGCLQKDTHNLKMFLTSIYNKFTLASFVSTGVEKLLTYHQKIPDDFSHDFFFSFRNLSPAKYRFHNKDSGKNIQGNTLRQKPPGQTPGGFGQSGNLYLGVSDRCEPEVLVSFT